jgi:hypothetical protein
LPLAAFSRNALVTADAPRPSQHEHGDPGLNLARPVDNSLDQPLDLKALDATMPLDPEAFEARRRGLARQRAADRKPPPLPS